jgi:DNA-binding MarR family transcriptional regulator
LTATNRLPMGLRRAYWAMHRHTDACFRRDGVTADQFVLLYALAERDGISQQELVHAVVSDPNTVRAMLVLLEGRGLVARGRHPSDGRARSVVLTEKGRRTYLKLFARSDPLRKRMLAVFRPKEATALVEYLTRLADAMAPSHQRRGRQRLAAPAITVGG